MSYHRDMSGGDTGDSEAFASAGPFTVYRVEIEDLIKYFVLDKGNGAFVGIYAPSALLFSTSQLLRSGKTRANQTVAEPFLVSLKENANSGRLGIRRVLEVNSSRDLTILRKSVPSMAMAAIERELEARVVETGQFEFRSIAIDLGVCDLARLRLMILREVLTRLSEEGIELERPINGK